MMKICTVLMIILDFYFHYVHGVCYDMISENNKVLNGSQIGTESIIGKHMCMTECLKRSGSCSSINYDRQNLKCDLQESDSITHPENLVNAPGSIYASSSPLVSENLGRCRNVSCPAFSYCLSFTSTYICVWMDCPKGYRRDGPVCSPCDAGYFSATIGSFVCTPCPSGTYNNDTGQTGCEPCSEGYKQGSTGQTSCDQCPAGSYSSSAGSTSCTLCTVGSIQGLPGQTTCEDCPAGSFQSRIGETSCQDCPAGYYQDTIAQGSCLPCGLGTHSTTNGSTTCTPCTPGTMANVTGLASCFLCDKGTYQSSSGASSCTRCQTDYYQNKEGQINCTLCTVTTPPWRKVTTADQKGCMGCYYGIGTYTDGSMSNVITTHSTSSTDTCAMHCENTNGCNGFTIRSSAGTCYIHSTNSWAYGYTYQSVFYGRRC